MGLPATLAPIFSGNQGNSSLKRPVVGDDLHGNLAALEVEAGTSPDQKGRLHVDHAQGGTPGFAGVRGSQADQTRLLGGRVKLPVRLLVRRLTPQAAEARRRQARAKAKKQGKTWSAREILLSHLTPSTWSLAQIFDLYPIRMPLEWVFRIWKDQWG